MVWAWPRSRNPAVSRISRLAPQIQALEQFLVLAQIVFLDVLKQFTSTTGQTDEAPAGMKILAVGPQMIREVVDSGRDQGDLHGTRAGIGLMSLVISYD